MNIKNRIIEYKVVQPGEVAPNPKNWRKHTRKQKEALKGVFAEIGIAGAVLAYHSARTGKLTLIDGHERMSHGVAFPALILDVTDAEADKLLAVHDPIGAMAEMDAELLGNLLTTVTSQNKGVSELLGVLGDSIKLPDMVDLPRQEKTSFLEDEDIGELESGQARKCPNCGFVSQEMGTRSMNKKIVRAAKAKNPLAALK